MRRRLVRSFITAGSALSTIGLIGAVVFQMQPWRSCPYDDSPAACAMLPADYAAFLTFVVLLLAGLITLLAAFVFRFRAARAHQRPTG